VKRLLCAVAGAALAVAGATAAAAAPAADVTSCPVTSGFTHITSANSGFDVNNGLRVQNNMWNGSHGPQTLFVNNSNDWGVCSNQPNVGKAVETYPDVEVPYYRLPAGNAPISKLTADRSVFAEHMPPASTNYIAEAAYDLWLNNWSIEVMIWTDNHGQVPFGHQVGTASIFGQNFAVWQSGTDAFAFVLDHNEQSGTVHILSTLKWLQNHGKIGASATITSAQFGWEVCVTNGQNLPFYMGQYSNTTLPVQYQP